MISPKPTRVRHKVMGFMVVLAFITYLDRVCIGIMAPHIMKDLGLTLRQMSYIFSAFALAYALFEIPTGHWGDLWGTRKVLTRIVLWWSSFTIFTSLAFGYGYLLVIRFLFGAGEAGAFPNKALTFSKWIPIQERGRAEGIFYAAAHFSGGVTPFLVTWLLVSLNINWRLILAVFGSVGFIWAFYWYRWFRDEPSEHPEVNEEELSLILKGRRLHPEATTGRNFWKVLLTSPNMWALCLMYIANGYGFYFFITWFPKYLDEFHFYSSTQLSILAGLPLFISIIPDLAGGMMTDWMTSRYGVRAGRVWIGFFGYLIGAVLVGLAAVIHTPIASPILIALGCASSMFTLGATWATCMEIGGKYTGTVCGVMNSASPLGGFLSPIVLAGIIEHSGKWNLPLYPIAAIYLFAAFCWLKIDPTKELFEGV
ncbi:MAG: MFS transporter [Verrucomicrobiota bacterium]